VIRSESNDKSVVNDEYNTLEGELQRLDESEQDLSRDMKQYGVKQRKMNAQAINND